MTKITRKEQKANTKAKVVEVAAGMFRAHGYDAVTFRAIAKKAEVSTGAIFASWDGKAALYESVTGERPPMEAAARFLLLVVKASSTAGTNLEAAEALRELAVEARRLAPHFVSAS